ncbi:sugar phosphate isomerase/epimerase family protein [Arthrobacter sp. MMS18-M83]|uniref:sugar phosphate isomerase/epimerase family protein n=1 Tax=Arthrobacter sp. MMS18-M83 TaxID=2996261 RepID=UPI00227B6088|nr:sugar phosphate isomerase/epimerase [Arthrobacter sp. MMS18-M83]WAH97299.1 sugar phosphate isomerase/epimerase [Arthrobacter sp. MMS18-M83]
MSIAPSQFALNPIQWLATPDGWVDQSLKPPLEHRLPVVASAGFTAIKSEVPIGMTAQTYRSRLGEYGIRPGPGYVPMPWFEDESSRAPFLERARTVAATNAVLGVPLVFLAMGMDKNAGRVLHPGVGFGQNSDRLESVRDYLAEAAQIMVSEGAVPALHPHVGTWIETADEARFVLDTVDESILKFGPDAGHLAWTGINPAELIAEYAPRVAGIHIKDYFDAVSARSRTDDIDYRSTVLAGFWTEPGDGDANIDEVLDAAGPGFDGWVVVEVDRGTVAPDESIRRCGEWLASRFTDPLPV